MANKQSIGKIKLLEFIKNENRIPTFGEAFDIYTDHVVKSYVDCWQGINGIRVTDVPIWRLEMNATSWFKSTLGILIMEGKIKIGKQNE